MRSGRSPERELVEAPLQPVAHNKPLAALDSDHATVGRRRAAGPHRAGLARALRRAARRSVRARRGPRARGTRRCGSAARQGRRGVGPGSRTRGGTVPMIVAVGTGVASWSPWRTRRPPPREPAPETRRRSTERRFGSFFSVLPPERHRVGGCRRVGADQRRPRSGRWIAGGARCVPRRGMGRLLGLHAAEGYREHGAALNLERRRRRGAPGPDALGVAALGRAGDGQRRAVARPPVPPGGRPARRVGRPTNGRSPRGSTTAGSWAGC